MSAPGPGGPGAGSPVAGSSEAEGSGAEGSGAERSAAEGSGAEGSGAEGSGAEGSGAGPPARRPRRRRRSPLLALLASSACALGLWILSPDLLYAAEGAPLQLDGREAPLAPERLEGNRFVHLLAPGEATGWLAELGGDRRELVLVPGARLIVLAPRRSGTEPALVPVDAEGRLLRGDRAGGWSAAAAAAAERRGGTEASYFVLVQGELPELPWGKSALALLLTVVLGLNLASLAPRRR